jgi:peptidoglycan-N-acetylglucosamine deacetylase
MPFIAIMGWLALEQQGLGVLIVYFILFILAHLIITAVAVRLMGEKYHHLLMVPVYRLVYEPLRAYLLYTSVFLAIKGGRMGWNKLVRTGSMDASEITAGLEDRGSFDSLADVLVPDDASTLATLGTCT